MYVYRAVTPELYLLMDKEAKIVLEVYNTN